MPSIQNHADALPRNGDNDPFPQRMIMRGMWPALALLVLWACDGNQERLIPIDQRSLRLAGGSAEQIEITLDAGAQLVVHAPQDEVDVALSLRDPGGRTLAESDSPMQRLGEEVLHFVPSQAGRYFVVVRATQTNAPSGFVKVRIEALATSTIASAYVDLVEAFRLARVPEDLSRKQALQLMLSAREKLEESGLQGDYANASLAAASHAYWNLADWRNAATYASQAWEAFREIQNTAGAADSLALKGAALVEAIAMPSDPDDADAERERAFSQATAALAEAERMHREQGRAFHEARDLSLTGLAHHYRGDLDRAEPYFANAARRFAALGESPSEVMALQSLAAIRSSRGEYREATEAFDRLLPLIDRNSEPLSYADVLHNNAVALSIMGEVEKALAQNLEALDIRNREGDVAGQGRSLHAIALAYRRLGNNERAIEFLRQAEPLRRSANDGRGLFVTLMAMGDLERTEKDLQQARRHHQAALAETRTTSDKVAAYLGLAKDELATANLDAASDLVAAAAALDISADHPLAVELLTTKGELLLARGKYSAAIPVLQDATARAKSLLRPFEQARSQNLLATAYRKLDRSDLAMAALDASVQLYEEIRSRTQSPDLRASLIDQVRSSYEQRLDLILVRNERDARTGSRVDDERAVQSLLSLDQARGRNLLDATAQRERTIDASKRTELESLYQALIGKNHRFREQSERNQPDRQLLLQLRLEGLELEARIDLLEGEKRGSGGIRTLDNTAARTSLLRYQASQSADAVAIEYFLGSSSSWAFAVTKSGISATRLPSATDIAATARIVATELRRPCVFRLMPAADSAAWRPPIPRHAGRVFRGMAATLLEEF